MKKLKKSLRLLGLICLLFLAVFGVGIAGGVPVPPSNKRENDIELKTELLDTEAEEEGLVRFDFRH